MENEKVTITSDDINIRLWWMLGIRDDLHDLKPKQEPISMNFRDRKKSGSRFNVLLYLS